MDYNKKFLIIGNQNAITYKEIFPYIKNNQLWLGLTMNGSNRWFEVPSTYEAKENAAGYKVVDGKRMLFVNGVTWFTNIENPRRNTPLDLYKKYNEKDFPKYDNYDAIEVSKVTDIPEDYDGVMGVPITFLYKYCPTQFEILECHEPCISVAILKKQNGFKEYKSRQIIFNGILCQKTYHRIFIKRIK